MGDKTQKITKILLVSVVLILMAWDLYVAIFDVNSSTESFVITKYAHEYPIMPFLMGLVIGHWLWSQKSEGDGSLDQ